MANIKTANVPDSHASKKRTSYSHAKADKRKAKRREQAEDRQFEYNELSLADKLAKAQSRRGESKREIARLTKLMQGPPAKVVVAKVAPMTSEQKGAKVVQRAQDAVAAMPSTKAKVKRESKSKTPLVDAYKAEKASSKTLA